MEILFEHTDDDGDTLLITGGLDGELVLSTGPRAVYVPRVKALELRNALDAFYAARLRAILDKS